MNTTITDILNETKTVLNEFKFLSKILSSAFIFTSVSYRHSQIEYQSNRRLNKNHHLNQQTLFQIHQLQLNHSIRLMAFHLILKMCLKVHYS
jgi:hypothetical protein